MSNVAIAPAILVGPHSLRGRLDRIRRQLADGIPELLPLFGFAVHHGRSWDSVPAGEEAEDLSEVADLARQVLTGGPRLAALEERTGIAVVRGRLLIIAFGTFKEDPDLSALQGLLLDAARSLTAAQVVVPEVALVVELASGAEPNRHERLSLEELHRAVSQELALGCVIPVSSQLSDGTCLDDAMFEEAVASLGATLAQMDVSATRDAVRALYTPRESLTFAAVGVMSVGYQRGALTDYLSMRLAADALARIILAERPYLLSASEGDEPDSTVPQAIDQLTKRHSEQAVADIRESLAEIEEAALASLTRDSVEAAVWDGRTFRQVLASATANFLRNWFRDQLKKEARRRLVSRVDAFRQEVSRLLDDEAMRHAGGISAVQAGLESAQARIAAVGAALTPARQEWRVSDDPGLALDRLPARLRMAATLPWSLLSAVAAGQALLLLRGLDLAVASRGLSLDGMLLVAAAVLAALVPVGVLALYNGRLERHRDAVFHAILEEASAFIDGYFARLEARFLNAADGVLVEFSDRIERRYRNLATEVDALHDETAEPGEGPAWNVQILGVEDFLSTFEGLTTAVRLEDIVADAYFRVEASGRGRGPLASEPRTLRQALVDVAREHVEAFLDRHHLYDALTPLAIDQEAAVRHLSNGQKVLVRSHDFERAAIRDTLQTFTIISAPEVLHSALDQFIGDDVRLIVGPNRRQVTLLRLEVLGAAETPEVVVVAQPEVAR